MLRVEWPCALDPACECQCHSPEWSGSFREICACRASTPTTLETLEKPEHRSDNCWCSQLPAVTRERIHLIYREQT